jgi:HTH-type transcriptional regulator, sugar sensing transcriptional regulator
MNIEILQEIGLSNTEAKVYLALLQLNSGLAGSITKKSGINRTNVYDALERLIEKGLVSYVISANRKVFKAAKPEKLTNILKEKQEKLKEIMPELANIYETNKPNEDATIFRGKKGLQSVYDDIIQEKKTLYAYGAEGRFSKLMPAYFKYWSLERERLGIKIKIVYPERIQNDKNKESFKLVERRYIKTDYEFPSAVLIYGEKVVMVVFTETPFAFMIKSKDAVKSHMNLFKLMWNRKKIKAFFY